jgi:hypothetical protein
MLRFRITSAAYAMMLVTCYILYFRPFGNALDAFGVLFCMCVLACIALWPRTDAQSEPDVATSGRNWSDRIELKASARAARTGFVGR